MNPIHQIISKDLTQMLRDRKTFLFLLLMPIAFTLLFGMAFKGPGRSSQDARLPVGLTNEDEDSPLSLELERFLGASEVIRLESRDDLAAIERDVAEKKLAAAIVIPAGYGASMGGEAPLKPAVLADLSTTAGLSAQAEMNAAAGRLASAVRTARGIAPEGGDSYDAALKAALTGWQSPPVRLVTSQAAVVDAAPQQAENPMGSFAHTSPGMILQFAIAGLLTCAQVIVSERKSRCLQRMLTTATPRIHILAGHYLAIFILIITQFAILILFGQLILKLDYLSQPLATLLVAFTAALCIAALGLLVGALAKGEEQAITFSLIGMFMLGGLGGAWVPLEYTGGVFQAVGHLSPVAWAMDGFKNVLIRGLDVSAAWLPAAALLGYAVAFFALASWRFKFE